MSDNLDMTPHLTLTPEADAAAAAAPAAPEAPTLTLDPGAAAQEAAPVQGEPVLSEEERQKAVGRCGANAEITRFKGLGEISPDEFREFIGENIRLDKVRITKDDPIHDLLEFYMGKNTYERQGFIIDNLRIEEDIVEQDLAIN